MFCRSCGKAIQEGTRFCRYCGASIDNLKENIHTDKPSESSAKQIKSLSKIRKMNEKQILLCVIALIVLVSSIAILFYNKGKSVQTAGEAMPGAGANPLHNLGDGSGVISANEGMNNSSKTDEDNNERSSYIQEELKPEAPVSSAETGKYTQSFDIALTSPERDSKIYYTLDGTDPDGNSRAYDYPIWIGSGRTVVKVISVSDSGVSSDITEYIYDVEQRGNTVGNTVNGGFAAIQGDWIYYRNSKGANRIYKTKTDGSENSMLNKELSLQINVKAEWIYYCMWDYEDQQSKIYKMRTDGSFREKLNNDSSWCINVVDDWIYYINMDDELKIYKIKTDGSERSKVSDVRCKVSLNVVDGWIYYIDLSDGMFKMKTDGSETFLLNENSCKNINVVDGWIYYTACGFAGIGSSIEKMKTDGSNWSEVTGDSNNFINVVDNWIYYSNKDDGGKIYKIKTDGSERCKLNDDDSCKNINIVGEWIYYDIWNDVYEYYTQCRIKTDGSDRSVFSN